MKLTQLRDHLADLRKKETIAQTREQLLNDEKKKLLLEVSTFLKTVQELGVIPIEELTPSNLPSIISKLQTYIQDEITKSNIPQELR